MARGSPWPCWQPVPLGALRGAHWRLQGTRRYMAAVAQLRITATAVQGTRAGAAQGTCGWSKAGCERRRRRRRRDLACT